MFATYLISEIDAYRRKCNTVRELSRLSGHKLDDIDISRYEIDTATREHARD